MLARWLDRKVGMGVHGAQENPPGLPLLAQGLDDFHLAIHLHVEGVEDEVLRGGSAAWRSGSAESDSCLSRVAGASLAVMGAS